MGVVPWRSPKPVTDRRRREASRLLFLLKTEDEVKAEIDSILMALSRTLNVSTSQLAKVHRLFKKVAQQGRSKRKGEAYASVR